MKKIFKIITIILVLLISALIAIPFVLESKIDAIVQNYVDKNINAKVTFDDISLSLISSFPKAEVNIANLNIITYAPFEKETLATAKNISFEMPIGELFKKGNEPLVVNDISVEELLLAIQIKSNDAVNYTILKGANEESSSAFSFDVKDYSIKNSAFTYLDESSQTVVYMTNINHSGRGVFSQGVSQMDTSTEANISLAIDSLYYLKNHSIKLEALIDLDLEKNTYTFRKNTGFINDLPLEFEGYVQLVENGQNLGISFKNPASDFKDFLAIIPEVYRNNLNSISTSGEFIVNGNIKGLISEETIPTMDISMVSNNASFKFPDLPKSVSDIKINASVKNTTGYANDTYIDINTFDFRIDQDLFKSEIHLKNITDNILVNAKLNGVLNLGNLSKAYPIDLEQEMSGVLKADLITDFDMKAIENNAYKRINTSGKVSIKDVVFTSKSLANPMQINQANLTFNPKLVSLNTFSAKTGQSDISANGSIQNLLGFLLSDKDLKGNFEVKSNTFAISDFMVAPSESKNEAEPTGNKNQIKIPAFLDCTINAQANTVLYDNLSLKNVSGQLVLKDESAILNNLSSNLFDGHLALNGNVSTKSANPTFNMQLGMSQFDVSKSFKGLELFQNLAPIASILNGKLNSALTIDGILNGDLTPQLNSLTGDVLAELFTTKINVTQSNVLKALSSKLNFINIEKLNLDDLKTNLSFKNGEVNVRPFKFMYEDIAIEVSGSHNFKNAMNYNVVLQVPAKYLGSEINRLIGKINDTEANSISIPVTANVTGSFGNPNVSTDLSSGISNLTKQLLEIQKQKLLGQGKDKIKDLLGDVLNRPSDSTTQQVVTKKDSTTTSTVEKEVKNILGNILKSSKKIKDSTKNQ